MTTNRQDDDGDAGMICGRHFLRALGYALKAAPSGDAQARMAHVVLHRHRIIAADGERWHVGMLPREAAIEEPFAATRESCDALKLSLEYAQRMAKMHAAQFYVSLAVPADDDEGLEVVLSYGAKHPIVHPLARCPVGHIPPDWEEPVPEDASAVSTIESTELRCGHVKEAMEWYRSWERDHGTCAFSWRAARGIVRLDIVSGGDLVAAAFLMPPASPPAQLVHDEPLFERLHPGRRVGQSILDLRVDGDGEAAEEPRRRDVLFVAGQSIGVRGIPDADQLVASGPCVHLGEATGQCPDCTVERVKEERRRLRAAKKSAAAEDRA